MRPYSPHKCLWKIKSKGFWYRCSILGITRFLDCVHFELLWTEENNKKTGHFLNVFCSEEHMIGYVQKHSNTKCILPELLTTDTYKCISPCVWL